MMPEEYKMTRRMVMANRSREMIASWYSGASENPMTTDEFFELLKSFYPAPCKYNVYFGEMHGHTCLSDGVPTLDEYFTNIRDNAKLDFAAVTDHDNAAFGKPELWDGPWDMTKEKVKEYYQPGKFTTILAYEKNADPWYANVNIYYNNHDGEMIRGERDGECTKKELADILSREDIVAIPHDTYHLFFGADFKMIPPDLFTPAIEICSRGDSAEYFGNPYNIAGSQFEGGFWQDALKRGAKMGCIGGSDDHSCQNGLMIRPRYEGDLCVHPGITGVLAEENTLESIFSAIKARRTFAFTGGRIKMDFRVNGHYMGEEFECDEERSIYFKIEADAPIKKITVVKNCRDYVITRNTEFFFYDNSIETDCDYYYLRVELEGGRCGWTSPIWIHSQK